MPHSELYQKIQEASLFIRNRFGVAPKTAIVFGSGLAGEFVARLKNPLLLSFKDLPHFQVPTVEGHGGNLYFGTLGKTPVWAFDGRFHYYEGFSIDEVVFPIRVLGNLGIKELLFTNSVGGLNPKLRWGDLMLVTDHLNLTGQNPLRGPAEEWLGPRFLDLSDAYDSEIRRRLFQAAKRAKTRVRKGIYVGISGPSYETAAELRMYRRLGGDAIGMSTVSEVIAARQMGIKTAVISCITNLITVKKQKLSHQQVVAEAHKMQGRLSRLLEEYLCEID